MVCDVFVGMMGWASACCWYAAVNKEALKQERGEHPNLETMITMATMTKTQSTAPQTIMTQAH